MAKPNVLFVLSDQHNAKFMGHTGLTDAITPYLDRMAAEGVRFDAAVCPVTICTPSRVAYLSGQYAHNSGYFGFGGNPPATPTVLGHFRRAGYHTGSVGKMHCPHHWLEADTDEFHETDRTSVGGSSKEYLDHLAARGIDIYHEYSLPPQPSPFAFEDSQEGWQAAKVIQIMRNAQQQKKPFFIHMSMTKPHAPYVPAKEFWDLYDQSRIRLPPNADYDLEAAGKAPYLQHVAAGARVAPDFPGRRLRQIHGYLGNVSHCDAALGQVLDFLDAAGLAEDTIVVYSADHGEYVFEHGPSEKVPGICADAVTRVPFIWRWGRTGKHLKSGHVVTQQVETIDVARTVCALTGVGAMDTADGCDLSPLLAGQEASPHKIAVTEYPLSKSVRKGPWRLVYYPPGFFRGFGRQDFSELYNLASDPWEMRNLYFDPQYAPVVRELERDLLEWMCTTNRPTTAYTPISARGADGCITPEELWNATPNAPYL